MKKNKIKKNRDCSTIKQLLISWFCLLFFLGFLLSPTKQINAQMAVTSPIDTAATLASDAYHWFDGVYTKIKENVLGKMVVQYIFKMLDDFTQNMAKKLAIGIATGAKGGKPLAFTQNMEDYIRDSADAAAGNFIEELSQGFGVDLCSPDLSVKLNISLALLEEESPKKPKCTFSQMVNNWEQEVNNPDFLKNFAVTFEPKQSELGVLLEQQNRKDEAKARKDRIAALQRGGENTGGYTGVKDPISGDTKTPPGAVESMQDKAMALPLQKELVAAQISATQAEKEGVLSIVYRGLVSFSKTLSNQLIKDYLSGTLSAQDFADVDWDELCKKLGGCDSKKISNLASSISKTSTTDPYSQDVTGGELASELKYSKYIKTNSFDSGTYEILSELASCPNPDKPGPTTCVITDDFASAVSLNMTIQEAIDEGLLDGDMFVGFNSEGNEPSYLSGYPYRSLLILRKYRIIPVGWELAAQYIRDFAGGKTETLKSLILAYNDASSPYYRFVNPDWVLKSPAGFCKAKGFGPEIVQDTITDGVDADNDGTVEWDDPGDIVPKRNIIRNENYCADEQTCIKEGSDGTCEFYGYCMEDKKLWKFDGESCSPNYATCQTLTDSDNNIVSYLKNSLDWNGCTSSNSGCMWYCDSFNPNTNSLASNNAVAYWNMNSATGDVINDQIGKNNIKLSGFSSSKNQFVSGKNGKALEFNGSSSSNKAEISNNSLLFPKEEISISGWIKTNGSTSTNKAIVSSGWKSSGTDKDKGYYLGVSPNSDAIHWQLRIPGCEEGSTSGQFGLSDTPAVLDNGKWHHIVGTYKANSGAMELYMDGKLIKKETKNCSKKMSQSTTNNIYIGGIDSLGNIFKGDIDEVSIYSKVLSGEDVWNLYNSYSCLNNDEKIYLTGQANSCDAQSAGCNQYLSPKENLLTFLKFDEDTGSIVYDGSGHKNNGNLMPSPSLSNMPTWSLGKTGQSLKFDGVDDYVDMGSSNDFAFQPDDSFSISVWTNFNFDDNETIRSYIINKRNSTNSAGWSLSRGSNKINFVFGSNDTDKIDVNSNDVVGAENEWYHIVATYDGSTDASGVKIYVNANNETSGIIDNDTGLSIDYTDNLELGTNHNKTSEYYMNGLIDNVAIYNKALSEAEIVNLYNGDISFSSVYTKASNKNLQCFGRTSGDAFFDLPSYVDNCISLGARYDSSGQGTCFEFLAYDKQEDCKKNNGTWSNSPIKISRHTAKSYCEASGGKWTGSECQTQCLKIDDSVCSKYAFNCKSSEVGCDKYTPTQGESWVPGVIGEEDRCPSQCAGYDTYKQESTNFETSKMLINFIPNTAKKCPATSAGCDEFTNTTSGEDQEYYSYLRQCESIPSESADYQCGTFYTWVGSDVSGYQLQSYFLKSKGGGTSEDPVEILRVEDDLGKCMDANDALTNQNCKEFYNSEGEISYHLLKKTITCSNKCTQYRKTEPASFDLGKICKNIGGTWLNNSCNITSEVACGAVNGSWASGSCSLDKINDNILCTDKKYLAGSWSGTQCTKTDYQAIPDEGVSCKSSEKGCREYTGNAGSNIMNVFTDNFENNNYIYNFVDTSINNDPDGSNGWDGGQLSSESTVAGQQSIKVNNGTNQTISKWLSATCDLGYTCTNDKGCSCTEDDFGYYDNDALANNEKVCTVNIDKTSCSFANYTSNKNSYLLSFWAKGNNTNNITAKINDHTFTQDFGSITLSDQWQFYTLGPVEFDVNNWDSYQLEIGNIKSNGGTSDSLLSAYFDNIKLEAVSDSLYIIKNSWITPQSCDQDSQGNLYIGYMLGCDEYTDSKNNINYLKSFSNLCRQESVGCQKLIDTHNSADPWSKTWNSGKESQATVEQDNFVYLAQVNNFSCNSNAVGCSMLGQPVFNQDKTIVESFTTAYKIIKPDNFSSELCDKENVGCKTYSSGSSNYYFKDPVNQLCEYVQVAGSDKYNWYKKADSYSLTSEKCPISDYQNFGYNYPAGTCVGGTENGNICLVGSSKYLVDKCVGGGGYCSNWAGTCPTTQSSCTTYIEPLSGFGVELVINNNFKKNINKDTTPDGWDISGVPVANLASYPSPYNYIDVVLQNNINELSKTIDIKENTVYVLSGEIEKISSSSVPAILQASCTNFTANNNKCAGASDKGFYLVDHGTLDYASGCNKDGKGVVMLTTNNLTSPAQRHSVRFYSGTCSQVKVSFGGQTSAQRFYEVSLKKAGVYNYLDNSISESKQECNGVVNNDEGCVLFNNRNNNNWGNLDYHSYLTYSADKKTSLPSNCSSSGSQIACDSDEIIKVSPDRDCDKWLYCTDTETVDGKEVCTDISICDIMNERGECIHNPFEYSEVDTLANMTYDSSKVKQIENLTGFSKVGFDWGGDKKIEGNLPPTLMNEFGKVVNVPNSGFESAVKMVTSTACTKAGGTCSGNLCSGGTHNGLSCSTVVPKAKNWTFNSSEANYKIINNPIMAQKEGVKIYSGRSVAKLNAGNSDYIKTDNYISISKSEKYYISGYINTKKLTPSLEARAAFPNVVVYGSIAIVEYDISNNELKTTRAQLANGQEWKFVQKDFTTHSDAVKIEIRLEDTSSSGVLCAKNCEGSIYFDDVVISPQLNAKTVPSSKHINRGCRLFPKAESLSCSYETDDGYKYDGWYGYCLEKDPTNSDYCLQWWPVDRIKGQEDDGGGAFDPSTFGRSDIYYCLGADSTFTDSYTQNLYLTIGTVYEHSHGAGGATRLLRTHFWDNDKTRRNCNIASLSCSGDSRSAENCINGNDHGLARNTFIEYAKNNYYGGGWTVGVGSVLDSNSNPCGYGNSHDNPYVHYGVTLQRKYDPNNANHVASASAPGISYSYIGRTYSEPTCNTIAQISTTSAENKAWYERLNSDSTYKDPILNYSYNTSTVPYGRINTSTLGSAPPSSWTKKLPASEYGYIPYYCISRTTGGYPPGATPANATKCENGSWGSFSITPSYYLDCASNTHCTLAQDSMKQLFATSYLVGDWNGSSYGNTSTYFSSWIPPTSVCSTDSHSTDKSYCYISPSISNINLNGGTSDIIFEAGSGIASLKFNTSIDVQQLPLVEYNVEWGDGASVGKTNLKSTGKPNQFDPYIFSHEYTYSTLFSSKDEESSISCSANCSRDLSGCGAISSSSKPFCRAEITIDITDNWGKEKKVNASSNPRVPYVYVISDT